MANYLLIESRDPFESNDVDFVYDLAKGLKDEGNGVTVFLVQNGVLPARPGPKSAPLAELSKAGIDVLADDFSLRERGIPEGNLASDVKAASLEVVVDQLAGGVKTIWH